MFAFTEPYRVSIPHIATIKRNCTPYLEETLLRRFSYLCAFSRPARIFLCVITLSRYFGSVSLNSDWFRSRLTTRRLGSTSVRRVCTIFSGIPRSKASLLIPFNQSWNVPLGAAVLFSGNTAIQI